MKPLIARCLLAIGALSVTGLMGLGVLDLVTRSSYLHRALSGNAGPRMAMLDEERVAAAAKTVGPFSAPIDPHVGITMKRGARRDLVGTPASMDGFGQRLRVGPEPVAGALRIAVLGDSVAFGFGVADDQTIGHFLEEYLARCCAVRPVVFTVACPGWNHHNEHRFLKSHLARLRPDVVLLLPIGNDLHDAYTVNEVGHRSLEYDPVRGAVQPHTSAEQYNLMMVHYAQASLQELMKVRAAGGLEASMPHVVTSGLAPESRRRWVEVVDNVRDLDRCLRARGARLAVGLTVDKGFEAAYRARIGAALPELPFIATFDAIGTADHLATDPHPNARYTRALAWCFAEFLVRQGWLKEVDAGKLPPIPEGFASRRVPARSPEQVRARADEYTAKWRAFFRSEVVVRDTTGFHQVYGAVYGDGVVNRTLLVALRNPGRGVIVMHFDRLRGDSGVYPLRLTARINGVSAGEMEVTPPRGNELADAFRIAVPASVRDEFVDLEVRASNWVVEQDQGMSRTASFKLLRVGFEAQ
ncbi:MAG: SGNH/GDSL hydrolase family protein [Planctomycetes bacterium]|nr:SGNH/GDSL hydrolase family protein [Planctomycetota bacterium]MCB9871167.1 SGNH/GDSL hydrolase family protein [Planctomycetota bacterium]